jgi:hypothetical protein
MIDFEASNPNLLYCSSCLTLPWIQRKISFDKGDQITQHDEEKDDEQALESLIEKEVQEREKEVPTKQCLQCKKDFEPKSNNSKFCCEECKKFFNATISKKARPVDQTSTLAPIIPKVIETPNIAPALSDSSENVSDIPKLSDNFILQAFKLIAVYEQDFRVVVNGYELSLRKYRKP